MRTVAAVRVSVSQFMCLKLFPEVAHPCQKAPEEQLPGAISRSTDSIKGRKDHFFSSPLPPLRNLPVSFLLQKHLQLLPALSGCSCSCQSFCVALKSQCSSFSRQVANCPLELLKTKNPGRERGSVLNIRLPWKSCARNNLYSDASHRWHNYLSVRSQVLLYQPTILSQGFLSSCVITLPSNHMQQHLCPILEVLRHMKIKMGAVMRDFLNSRKVSVHLGDQRNALPFSRSVYSFSRILEKPQNELSVMVEHYEALHICKAGNLASSAQFYFYLWKFPPCWLCFSECCLFFQASNKLEFRCNKDCQRDLSCSNCQLFQSDLSVFKVAVNTAFSNDSDPVLQAFPYFLGLLVITCF